MVEHEEDDILEHCECNCNGLRKQYVEKITEFKSTENYGIQEHTVATIRLEICFASVLFVPPHPAPQVQC